MDERLRDTERCFNPLGPRATDPPSAAGLAALFSLYRRFTTSQSKRFDRMGRTQEAPAKMRTCLPMASWQAMAV